jgi:hypothetical protein
MANTLTNLTPDLYAALDQVSRELVGMIPAVSRDSGVERAALNQTVRSFVAPAASASDVTAGQLAADNGDQTIGNKTISISKSRYVPVRWNGEEQQGMNTGPGYNNILRDQFAQAMRTLVNEIEEDLAGLYVKASRAVAPSGTTLFDAAATVGKDVANVRKVLADNGAPMSDLQLVLNTSAGAALRGNPQYSGANTAGQENILRQGILADLSGFAIRESAGIATHTNGDYDGLAEVDAVEPIGETSISVDTQGSGGVLAGDVVTLNGANYVVSTANADTDSGNIDITAPGLLAATASSGQVVGLSASLDRNMAFSRNAIHLVTRAPARPAEGDSAADVMIIQDPRSGLAFEVSMYKEYRQVKYEIALAWGFEMIKPEHCALLID